MSAWQPDKTYIDQTCLKKHKTTFEIYREYIMFCFADPNGNLKVKFNDNKNMSFDSFKSLWGMQLRENWVLEN